MIPEPVLKHLGRELGIAVPRLASIRGLYRRRRTLFEHQAAAKLSWVCVISQRMACGR